MASHDGLKDIQFSDEVLMGHGSFAKFDESLDYINADFDGHGRIQNSGRHERSMFGKRQGQNGREFEVPEVITICDNLPFFTLR